MSVLCIDNVPEGVVNNVPPVARKVRRPAEQVRNGRTRCPDCCTRLAYTDWDDPQKVIRLHQETECPKVHAIITDVTKRRPRRRSSNR